RVGDFAQDVPGRRVADRQPRASGGVAPLPTDKKRLRNRVDHPTLVVHRYSHYARPSVVLATTRETTPAAPTRSTGGESIVVSTHRHRQVNLIRLAGVRVHDGEGPMAQGDPQLGLEQRAR